VIDQCYAPLFRFAMSLTRTEHAATDLVQETFMTWAEKGGQLRDSAKARAWLFTTLHRRFLAGHRRIVKFPEVEIQEGMPDLPVVEADYVSRLDAQTAVDLLAQVDEQYRAVVALFYLEDYSYDGISEVLGIPLGTVKSRLARGLAQLKDLVFHAGGPAVRKEGL
jgi:RNA polymerase sigma-70 factor (ECF subfamily)